MKKLISFFISLLAVPAAYAHCPLCTAAVGAAALSAKYYGLDVSIIGLLIGAFAVSTGLWVGLKIKKFFRFQLAFVVLLSFLSTVIPLKFINGDLIYFPLLLLGPPGFFLNKVYWIDKLLLGSVIGAAVTLAAFFAHSYIKKSRGKVFFPFQGITITLFMLLLSGLGLYFTIGG
jgi:hypothetical protein